MNNQNYYISISAAVSAKNAIAAINNLKAWWATDFEGSSEKLHDCFTIRFGETWVNFEVTEVIRDQRITWLITDCHLQWLKDKKEWRGHTIIWDVKTVNGNTQIDFTQIGLTPQIECYTDCEKGWNFYVGESLFKLITTGKGKPDTSKDKRVVL